MIAAEQYVGSVMFKAWIQKRRALAIRDNYGHENIVLILDNATHHLGMANDPESPPKATKTANAALLRGLGTEITAQRDGVCHDFAVAGGESEFRSSSEGGAVASRFESRITPRITPSFHY